MTEDYYVIRDLNYPSGRTLNTAQMIKYAKDKLRHNKRIGLDLELTQKDLDRSINAWLYLKNIGLGTETNKKIWK